VSGEKTAERMVVELKDKLEAVTIETESRLLPRRRALKLT